MKRIIRNRKAQAEEVGALGIAEILIILVILIIGLSISWGFIKRVGGIRGSVNAALWKGETLEWGATDSYDFENDKLIESGSPEGDIWHMGGDGKNYDTLMAVGNAKIYNAESNSDVNCKNIPSDYKKSGTEVEVHAYDYVCVKTNAGKYVIIYYIDIYTGIGDTSAFKWRIEE